MDAGLLERLLGGNRVWSGPCSVIVDAQAVVKTPGPDSIVTGGMKSYAPRVTTGRLVADSACLLREENAVLVVEQSKFKDASGVAHIKQQLTIVDVKHVVGLAFENIVALKLLGVEDPPVIDERDYRPGTLVG